MVGKAELIMAESIRIKTEEARLMIDTGDVEFFGFDPGQKVDEELRKVLAPRIAALLIMKNARWN